MPISIEVAIFSSSYTTIQKNMKYVQCVKIASTWFGPGLVDNSTDKMNAIQIYKDSQSNEETLLQHSDTKQHDAPLQMKRWIETLQFNERLKELKPRFLKRTKMYKSVWNDRLDQNTVAKHPRALNPPDAPPIHCALYCAGLRQKDLERNEIFKMQEAGVTKLLVAEMSNPSYVCPKMGNTFCFCVCYRWLNSVAMRDIYPIPAYGCMDACIEFLGKAQILPTLDENLG